MGADPDEAAAEFRAMTVTRTQLRMLAGLFDAAEISDASKEAPAPPLTDLYSCMGAGARNHGRPRGRASNDRRVENQP